MRLINGVDLAACWRRQGPLAPPRAVATCARSLAPTPRTLPRNASRRQTENILVMRMTSPILSISIASADERLTQLGGNMVGTLLHGARAVRRSHATYRADIYALTCVLYECLTGSPPYQETSSA